MLKKPNIYLIGVDALATHREFVFEQDNEEEDAIASAVAEVEAMENPGEVPPPPQSEIPSLPPEPLKERFLQSEIEGVSDEAWTNFVLSMKTALPNAVSASGAFGMFEMRPRRLADLGITKNVVPVNSPTRRMMWIGEWVPPLTEEKFLKSPKIQYETFVNSMKNYDAGMADGSIKAPEYWPEEMTWSGALAILHKCGPSGLVTWADEERRLPATLDLYYKTNGLF